MPLPELPDDFSWSLDDPGSRFTRVPALALGVPEEEWGFEGEAIERGTSDALRRHLGEWAFEQNEELGRPEAVPSSTGRGAAGVAVALEWIAAHAAGGVVSMAAGLAFKEAWQRARETLKKKQGPRLYVSRGGAALLAAVAVSEQFAESSALEIEAVEEPSSIAGRRVSELSYVGVEPWIVFLLNRNELHRYIAVVAPDGEVLATMQTPMGEWEHIFLLSPGEGDWAKLPPARQRWWRERNLGSA